MLDLKQGECKSWNIKVAEQRFFIQGLMNVLHQCTVHLSLSRSFPLSICSREKLNPGIFFQEYTEPNALQVATMMAVCLKDNYCAPLFKLKFFTPTCHILFLPKPSKCYGESDFIKSVSQNKLGKYYTVLWFKRRDFYF